MVKRLRKRDTSQLSIGFMNTCTHKSTQERRKWKRRGGGTWEVEELKGERGEWIHKEEESQCTAYFWPPTTANITTAATPNTTITSRNTTISTRIARESRWSAFLLPPPPPRPRPPPPPRPPQPPPPPHNSHKNASVQHVSDDTPFWTLDVHLDDIDDALKPNTCDEDRPAFKRGQLCETRRQQRCV